MLIDWTGPLEGLHRHAAVVPISTMGVVIYYLLYYMRMFSIIIIIKMVLNNSRTKLCFILGLIIDSVDTWEMWAQSNK